MQKNWQTPHCTAGTGYCISQVWIQNWYRKQDACKFSGRTYWSLFLKSYSKISQDKHDLSYITHCNLLVALFFFEQAKLWHNPQILAENLGAWNHKLKSLLTKEVFHKREVRLWRDVLDCEMMGFETLNLRVVCLPASNCSNASDAFSEGICPQCE